MKLLVMSDIHAEFQRFDPTKLPDAEVVLIAGDITNYGTRNYGLAEFMAAKVWMQKIAERYQEVYWIPGNHDIGFQRGAFGHSTPCVLNTRWTFPNGMKGWGVSCSPCYDLPGLAKQWDFMTADIEEEKRMYGLIPSDTDIILSHSPPRDCLDSAGLCYDPATGKWEDRRIGSECLRAHIEACQPKLVVCGHCHHDRPDGIEDWIGKTHVVNVAETGKVIDL